MTALVFTGKKYLSPFKHCWSHRTRSFLVGLQTELFFDKKDEFLCTYTSVEEKKLPKQFHYCPKVKTLAKFLRKQKTSAKNVVYIWTQK